MDWATQPDPFRRHEGAELRKFPQSPGPHAEITWDALFGPPAEPVVPDEQALGALFFRSLALSAAKEVVGPDGLVAQRWFLRVNPSSGNLHPTEGWLGTPEGLFHYRPDAHGVEHLATWEPGAWEQAIEGLPAGTLLLGLSSIFWREAWKYGERAFRYCQHDVGHAMAALSLAAATLGWRVARVEGAGTRAETDFLGLADRTTGPEAEHPDLVCALFTGSETPAEPPPITLPRARLLGHAPNPLSSAHAPWPIIDEVAAAVETPAGSPRVAAVPAPSTAPAPDRGLNASDLVRGRRSAVAMDGRTALDRADFFRMLQRLLPTPSHPAFALCPATPQVALLIFVHRVNDVAPGLYILARGTDHAADLQAHTRDVWEWAHPDGCPDDLPLHFLGGGDLRAAARQVSCGQDIAADGAFAVGMLARFDGPLQDAGPGAYPELFRETGAIGQVLYLEADAAGTRGTGIGCFFDDEVHRILGLEGTRWQSLYHFTVGGAVDDPRLRTASPYPANEP